MTEKLCLGAIAGAFGVRGEVRLKSFCAHPEDVAAYGALSTEDNSRSFEITLGRQIKSGFAARLSGVLTKEQADALKGARSTWIAPICLSQRMTSTTTRI